MNPSTIRKQKTGKANLPIPLPIWSSIFPAGNVYMILVCSSFVAISRQVSVR